MIHLMLITLEKNEFNDYKPTNNAFRGLNRHQKGNL